MMNLSTMTLCPSRIHHHPLGNMMDISNIFSSSMEKTPQQAASSSEFRQQSSDSDNEGPTRTKKIKREHQISFFKHSENERNESLRYTNYDGRETNNNTNSRRLDGLGNNKSNNNTMPHSDSDKHAMISDYKVNDNFIQVGAASEVVTVSKSILVRHDHQRNNSVCDMNNRSLLKTSSSSSSPSTLSSPSSSSSSSSSTSLSSLSSTSSLHIMPTSSTTPPLSISSSSVSSSILSPTTPSTINKHSHSRVKFEPTENQLDVVGDSEIPNHSFIPTPTTNDIYVKSDPGVQPITREFSIDTVETPPDSPTSSVCSSPPPFHENSTARNNTPLNLSSFCLRPPPPSSPGSPHIEDHNTHNNYTNVTKTHEIVPTHHHHQTETKTSSNEEGEAITDCDKSGTFKSIIPSKRSENESSENKITKKTNFSIDAILSSSFGVETTNSDIDDIITVTDNEKYSTQSVVNDQRNNKPISLKSSNSAFTAVDLSLKSRQTYSSIPSPTETPSTPPSPPLSSPSSTSSKSSSSSSSSLQPTDYSSNNNNNNNNTANKFFNDDDVDGEYNDVDGGEYTTHQKFYSDSNNYQQKLNNSAAYIFDPRQNIENATHNSSITLQRHPFLHPLSIVPGSTLLKNPSLFMERHFPMFYNTRQIMGNYPLLYNNPIQNIPTNVQMPQDVLYNNMNIDMNTRQQLPQNLNLNILNQVQGAHIMNSKLKSQIIPNQSPAPNPVMLPNNDTINQEHNSPKPPANNYPNLYTKFSMSIKDKLNSLLEDDIISPLKKEKNYQNNSSCTNKQSNHKKEQTIPNEKPRKNLQDRIKPEILKQNAQKKSNRDVLESTQNEKVKDNKKSEGGSDKGKGNPLLPAWVFCTRYSDRPSSGPRSRKPKRKPDQDEKRPRTAFTNDQLQRLKREFDDCRYLTETRRQHLANELGLSESQIKIWFQNKRAKIKKSVGQKNPLALQLMKQGLYNHSTMKSLENDGMDCDDMMDEGIDD